MRNVLLGYAAWIMTAATGYTQTVDESIRALQSADTSDRLQAALKLGRAGDARAIPALVKALSDSEKGVQQSAAHALQRIGSEAYVPVAAILDSKDREERRWAFYLLVKLGPSQKQDIPADVLKRLSDQLEDKDAETWSSAASAIGALGPKGKSLAPALRAKATDLTPYRENTFVGGCNSVAEAAVDALAKVDPDARVALAKEIMPILETALQEALLAKKDSRVGNAAATLGRLGPAAINCTELLEKALAKVGEADFAKSKIRGALSAIQGDTKRFQKLDDPKTPDSEKAEILETLSYSLSIPTTPAFLAILTRMTLENEVRIRLAAIRVIRALGAKGKPLAQALMDRLGDEEIVLAVGGQSGLGFLADIPPILAEYDRIETIPKLLTIMKDHKEPLLRRAEAVRTLGKMGRGAASARADLKKVTEERNLYIAFEAAKSFLLAGGEPEEIEKLVLSALKADSPALRAKALATATATPSALEHWQTPVSALLTDDEPALRIMAAEALCQLGEKAKPTIPAILKLLRSKDARVRAGAIKPIGNLGPLASAAVPDLIEELDQIGNSGPFPPLVALRKIGPGAKEAIPKLLELAQVTKGPISSLHLPEILACLGAIGSEPKEVVPVLTKLANRQDDIGSNTEAALLALGAFGTEAKDAAPSVRKLLVHPKIHVRICALAALAKIAPGGEDNVREIVELWKDDIAIGGFSTVDYTAVNAFQSLGATAQPARDFLLEVVANPKLGSGTRLAIWKTLANLDLDGPTTAKKIAPLLTKVDGPNRIAPDELTVICGLFEKLGVKANGARSSLEPLVTLGDPILAEAAERALKAMAEKK